MKQEFLIIDGVERNIIAHSYQWDDNTGLMWAMRKLALYKKGHPDFMRAELWKIENGIAKCVNTFKRRGN